MRELTKSAFSFSWAMSLFGAQQMLNVFRPAKAVRSFEQITSVTEAELEQSLQRVFKTGDALQSRLTDALFAVLTSGRSGQDISNNVQIAQGASLPNRPAAQTRPATQRPTQSA